MAGRYAYSYDREDYTGSYDTPEQALAAAVERSEGLSSPPTEIFVGQLVESDPQATDHAQTILHNMSQRAHVDFGEPARRYLKNVPGKLVRELDDAVAQTILAWLKKHNLMPTFVQVKGIREYPVPLSLADARNVLTEREVHEIGNADLPENGL